MDDRNDVPYESALDLPSMQKMLRDISGAKALTRFVARDKRADIIAIEDEIRRLGEAVDGFYALLGDRNWIFTEDLSITLVESILSLPADEAERTLIDSFKDEASLRLQILHRTRQIGWSRPCWS